MKNVRIIYCLDGYNSVEIPIHSANELVARLQEIAIEAIPIIDGIFSADVVVEGFGRISVGLNQRCILTYTKPNRVVELGCSPEYTAQHEQ